MPKVKNSSILPFSFFLLSCLLSCSHLLPNSSDINQPPGIDVTNIRDLKPDPHKQITVYLQGKVVKQVPLVEQQVYQLQDATGTIWVTTKQKDLRLQEQVLIKGIVHYQSIFLAGKDFGEAYVEEKEQLKHTAAQ